MGYFKEFYIDGKKVKSLYLNGKKVKLQSQQVLGPLCFTAKQANSTIKLQKNSSLAPSVALKVSSDGQTWNSYTVGNTITLSNIGDKVYFKANGSNAGMGTGYPKYNKFVMTGKIEASGNTNSLLEENEETARTMSLSGKSWCYGYLFDGCTSLETAPELPATTIAGSCYCGMFQGCSSLKSAPELPATTLAEDCYSGMFQGCSSLTTPPELPATTIASNCYISMFLGCTSLETAPELPATTLAMQCYTCMFQDCSSLTTPPELPATELADICYASMFYGCSSLKISDTQVAGGVKFLDIPSGTSEAALWNDSMFSGTGGTFTSDPQIGQPYYYYQ